jgi:PAS domain-containing protein
LATEEMQHPLQNSIRAVRRLRGEGSVAPLSALLFADDSILNLRDIALSQSDAPQTLGEKLARVILDEMYQFVSLLDVNGMALEINRAALEGAGIQLKDIQGRPFWEARWWQVCSETREKQCELS